MTTRSTEFDRAPAPGPAPTGRLTMLVEMLGADTAAAVRDLAALGIRDLDLKQHVFGRSIADLDDATRDRLAALLAETGTSAYCFSSVLGHQDVGSVGETAFRRDLETGVANMLETARVARPAKVRLLACKLGDRAVDAEANADAAVVADLDRRAPWVWAAYRDAVDALAAAGLAATIENEPDSVLANPAATGAFFAKLDRPGIGFTWDIQNMWQAGTWPSVDVYRTLRPLTDYVHLKGGRCRDGEPGPLAFRCPLDEAAWPVREIVAAVLADGASPVICLNPSHGAIADGYSLARLAGTPELTRAEALRDVAFLRATFGAIA